MNHLEQKINAKLTPGKENKLIKFNYLALFLFQFDLFKFFNSRLN